MTRVGARVVDRGDLRVGPLLAEGGEGRVYELDDQRGVLLKEYRQPAARAPLAGLVAWPEEVGTEDPALASRVAMSAAWPSAIVVDDRSGSDRAAGLLLPRAPRRFSLRHRDGEVRLATLSYLTASPGQRAAAYGLTLPAPWSTERLGLVYALARLLEAFQAATPSVGHGDLSTKNVLWSLERGPEVFVLDCDSAERYGPDGVPLADGTGDDVTLGAGPHRRRAMTPNWDDPAIAPGSNPTPESDRYSLALIFLRVVGAAHFPIQGRQRRGEPLHIDYEVPPAAMRARSLDADAAVWDLCERSLGRARPSERPPAGEWAAALEQILDDLGAMRTVRAVWAAQGGGRPGPTPPVPPPVVLRPDRDVRVRPVPAASRPESWRRPVPVPTRPRPVAPTVPGRAVFVPNAPGLPGGRRPTAVAAVATGPSMLAQARDGIRRAAVGWLELHRTMLRALRTRGGRGVGVGRLIACALLDLVVGLWALFLLGVFFGAFLKL